MVKILHNCEVSVTYVIKQLWLEGIICAYLSHSIKRSTKTVFPLRSYLPNWYFDGSIDLSAPSLSHVVPGSNPTQLFHDLFDQYY